MIRKILKRCAILVIAVSASALTGCGSTQQALFGTGTNLISNPKSAVEARTRYVSSNKPIGLSPRDLQSAYNLPVAKKGTGQIVAIVDAYDNPNVASDLAEYRSEFKLSSAKFTKYNQNGETSNYPQGSATWGLTIDTDVEMVSASCPNCTIYLIEANSSDWSDIEAAEAEAVILGAKIVSNNYSGQGADKSYFDTSGITYLGSGNNPLSEPADFESVVAVGGTELSKGGGGKRGWTEEVTKSGGSGACIKSIRRPRWQHDSYCRYRLANDVGAVNEDVAIYDSYGEGGWVNLLGGTSTPLVAGVFGLAENATRQNGGRTFWDSQHRKYLFPVVLGSAEECSYEYSNDRYNSCSGWGSPDGIGAF